MRLPRLALVSLPALMLSCFSSSEQTDAGPGLDASPPDVTVPDGSVPDSPMEATAEAASDATVDAPGDAPVDAAPDAPPEAAVDAAPAPVVLTVVTPTGAPEQGVTVVFQDSTGAVIAEVLTDVAGRASKVVPDGSQVTVLLGTPSSAQIVTIESVSAGDALTALDGSAPAGAPVSIDSLPGSPPGTTTSYSVLAGSAAGASCSTGFVAPPSLLSLSAQCQSGGDFPLLVLAENSSYVPVGFTYQKGNSLANPDDAGVVHVAVASPSGPDAGPDAGWSTTTTTETVVASAPPATSVTLAFEEIAGGVPVGSAVALPAPDDAGVQGSPFPVHAGFPDAVQAEANALDTALASGASYRAIATRSSPPATSGSTSLDMSTLLPEVTGAAVDGATMPARPTLAWTSASSLASADGAIDVMSWNITTDAGYASGSWTIYAPSSATSVQAPALPSTASAWAPAAGASFATPQVIVVKATFLGSYGAFRAQVPAYPVPNLTYTTVPIVPPLPAAGTLLLSAFTQNPS